MLPLYKFADRGEFTILLQLLLRIDSSYLAALLGELPLLFARILVVSGEWLTVPTNEISK